MTPNELDRLHLRLMQIGAVLSALYQGNDAVVRKRIRMITAGMNPDPEDDRTRDDVTVATTGVDAFPYPTDDDPFRCPTCKGTGEQGDGYCWTCNGSCWHIKGLLALRSVVQEKVQEGEAGRRLAGALTNPWKVRT